MADPNLTITIQLVQQQARQAFREFAETSKSAIKEVGDVWTKEHNRMEGSAKEYFARMRLLERDFWKTRINSVKAASDFEEREGRRIAREFDENIKDRKKQLADLKRAITDRYRSEDQEQQKTSQAIKRMLDEQEAYSSQKRQQQKRWALQDFLDRADTEKKKNALVKRALDEQEAYESQKRLERKQIAFQDFLDRNKALGEQAEAERKQFKEYQDRVRENARAVKRERREEVKAGEDVRKALEEDEQAILNVARAYTTLRIVSEIQQTIMEHWKEISAQIKQVGDQLKGFYDEAQQTMERWAELATYQGVAPGKQHVAGLYRRAQRLGLRGEQLGEFLTGAYGQAAQVVGAGKPIAQPEFEKFAEQAAQFAVGVMNIQPQEAAKLVGTVALQAPPGSTAKDLMGRFAPLMLSAQQMVGRTGPMAGQLARTLQRLVRKPGDVQEMKGLVGMTAGAAAFIGPEQAHTYVQAIDRLYEDILHEASRGVVDEQGRTRAQALGLRPGMTLPEANRAITEAQQNYLKRHPGETAWDFSRKIARSEVRQFYGTIAQQRGAEVQLPQTYENIFQRGGEMAAAGARAYPGSEIARERAFQAEKGAVAAEQGIQSESFQNRLKATYQSAVGQLRDTETDFETRLRAHDPILQNRLEQEQWKLAVGPMQRQANALYMDALTQSGAGKMLGMANQQQRLQEFAMQRGTPEAYAALEYHNLAMQQQASAGGKMAAVFGQQPVNPYLPRPQLESLSQILDRIEANTRPQGGGAAPAAIGPHPPLPVIIGGQQGINNVRP